ncbi:hypothetical protein [Microcoleus sp. herbarium13]|uniref:hypothetical protein n=1 Tax=Microcoleus sp. herbarium13 TaxID=3055438 RepID=UPI002FD5B58A
MSARVRSSPGTIRKTWQFESDRIPSNTGKLKAANGSNCAGHLNHLKVRRLGRSVMRKLLYFATIGMLAFSIGGCGGDGGGDTASPTPSPALTPGAASPGATANAPGTPGAAASPTPAAQTFPSPVVAAQPPGLIRPTNPDERARQTQADIEAKKTAPGAPLNQTAIPQILIPGKANDPFSILPPQPLRTDGGTAGNELPNLPTRQVPNLPKLPDDRNPPQWTPAQRPRTAGGGVAQLPKPQSPAEVSSLPNLPLTSPPPQWRPPISDRPQAAPGRPGTRPGRPGTRPAGSPNIAGSPASIPGLPSIPGFPTGTTAGPRGTPGRPGAAPGRPATAPGRPAIAARPPSPPTIPNIATRELPGLPKLPELTPPPSWQDPNPPPPPAPPPPPPSTDNAKGVEVSGVVRVGNDILVIVKAPNEPTSRYIKVGQRIASGQVLIKRVDFKSGADPIVILEENGVEVSKIVGEKSPKVAQNPV